MPASTLLIERPTTEYQPTPPSPAGPGPSRARKAMPLVAMVVGLLVVAIAATVLQRATTTTVATTGADPPAITLSARDVSVVIQVYEPGKSSGWHHHPGIHAVTVLTGALTVYDQRCLSEQYGPGRPYVGGQLPHVVRNEGGEPVTMAVTYLNPSAPVGATVRDVAPAGCAAG